MNSLDTEATRDVDRLLADLLCGIGDEEAAVSLGLPLALVIHVRAATVSARTPAGA